MARSILLALAWIGVQPQVSADGNKVIAHICNDGGGWGKGFVLAVSARWPEPEREYRKAVPGGLTLGSIQPIPGGNHHLGR